MSPAELPGRGDETVQYVLEEFQKALPAIPPDLLSSLADYPLDGKVRWSSLGDTKDDVAFGACIVLKGKDWTPERVQSFFRLLGSRGRDDLLLPVYYLRCCKIEVTTAAFRALSRALLSQGRFCKIQALELVDVGLQSDVFRELLQCVPLTKKLQKLDVSRNADLCLPESRGVIQVLLDRLPNLELLHLEKTGFTENEMHAFVEMLGCSRLRLSLKGLRLGPPAAPEPVQVEARDCLWTKIRGSCLQLQFCGIWGLANPTSLANDGSWTWKLEDDAAIGTSLNGAGLEALDPQRGHIIPTPAVLDDQEQNQELNEDPPDLEAAGADPAGIHSRPDSAASWRRPAGSTLEPSIQRRSTSAPRRKRNVGGGGMSFAGGMPPTAAVRDFAQAADRHPVVRASNHSARNFEEVAFGVIDLEGENDEDDARAQLVNARQRDFFAEIDGPLTARPGQRRSRLPPMRPLPTRHEPEEGIEMREDFSNEPSENGTASPQREMYGGEIEVSDMEASPFRDPEFGNDSQDMGQAFVADDVAELEFGLDAEKEKLRRQPRRHLTEAEDLKAFGFEDEETAREHQAGGHFGVPLDSVRATRVRQRHEAAERLRRERLARDQRMQGLASNPERLRSESSSRQDEAEAEMQDSPRQPVDLLGDFDSQSEEEEPTIQPSKRAKRLIIVESEDPNIILPDDCSDQQEADDAPGEAVAEGTDLPEAEDEHARPGSTASSGADVAAATVTDMRAAIHDPANLAAPARQSSEGRAGPDTDPSPQARVGVSEAQLLENPAASHPMTAGVSAAPRKRTRMSEADRLKVLWANDKRIGEHPANAGKLKLGLELPEGAKRLAKRPERYGAEETSKGVQSAAGTPERRNLGQCSEETCSTSAESSDDDRPISLCRRSAAETPLHIQPPGPALSAPKANAAAEEHRDSGSMGMPVEHTQAGSGVTKAVEQQMGAGSADVGEAKGPRQIEPAQPDHKQGILMTGLERQPGSAQQERAREEKGDVADTAICSQLKESAARLSSKNASPQGKSRSPSESFKDDGGIIIPDSDEDCPGEGDRSLRLDPGTQEDRGCEEFEDDRQSKLAVAIDPASIYLADAALNASSRIIPDSGSEED